MEMGNFSGISFALGCLFATICWLLAWLYMMSSGGFRK